MSVPTLLVPGSLLNPPLKDVPIDYIISWIKKRMPQFGAKTSKKLSNRILIVKSKTGSGKSTALPVYLFRILRDEKTPARFSYRGRSVLCTQPRVLTARTLAEDISREKYYPDMILGTTVGYQTGPYTDRPLSGLIYATAGVLLAQLRTMSDEDIIANYEFIIIDEAHERSLEIDSVLMRLKTFYQKNITNPRLPFLILASATIDTNRYARFFGIGSENIIEITGTRPFKIKDKWPPHGTNNYLKEAAELAVRIHEENIKDPPGKGDILIFAPGKKEYSDIAIALKKANKKYTGADKTIPPFLVLQIDSKIVKESSRDYRLLRTAPDTLKVPVLDQEWVLPARRIIVSTVVAETGLTIETLKYVIDSGWNRAREQYFPYGASGLITRPAPKSRVTQRKGRVGRKFAGEFHPLYTKKIYEILPPQQLPDIVIQGPENIILDIVEIQQVNKTQKGEFPEFRIEDIDMLDPPPSEALSAAIEKAVLCGFISDHAILNKDSHNENSRGWGITEMGAIASKIGRLSLEEKRIILAGYVWNVSIEDLITIIAFFDRPLPLIMKGVRGPPGASALRAGLPDYLIRRVGGDITAEEIPPTESESFYYRARLLISDDFIERLLMFEGFSKAVESTDGDPAEIRRWCTDIGGLEYEGMIEIIKRREAIIEDLLLAEVNPFWGYKYRLVKTQAKGFMDTIKRIKHCLYEGLRLNLLIYDEKENLYRTRHGLPVRVPKPFTDQAAKKLRGLGIRNYKKPARILTDNIKIALIRPPKGKQPQLIYELRAGSVSVLDGYINTDDEFILPRKSET